MLTREEILKRVGGIKVWSSGEKRAPHKPLLLLYALAQAENGIRDLTYAQVDPVLSSLLREFGPPVPPGSSVHPEYPFWYLRKDDLWEVVLDGELVPKDRTGDPPPLTGAIGRLPEEVFESLCMERGLLHEVANNLLQEHFPESLHDDILDAVGMSPDFGGGYRKPRNRAFRELLLMAYEHRCAICGFQAKLGHKDIGLEAAHIRWHQYGGTDDEPNGLALCVMHHKLFDRGAMTVENKDLTVRVSQQVYGVSGFAEWVMGFNGKPLLGPQHPDYRPARANLLWHREEVFKEPQRYVG